MINNDFSTNRPSFELQSIVISKLFYTIKEHQMNYNPELIDGQHIYTIAYTFEQQKEQEQSFIAHLIEQAFTLYERTADDDFPILPFVKVEHKTTPFYTLEYNFFIKALADFVDDEMIIHQYQFDNDIDLKTNKDYLRRLTRFKNIFSAILGLYKVNSKNPTLLINPSVCSVESSSNKLYKKYNGISFFTNVLDSNDVSLFKKLEQISTYKKAQVDAFSRATISKLVNGNDEINIKRSDSPSDYF